ncbi:hypothetical protein DICVIV_00026 [Dictyocaulus viviparus]|uniref:SCP domain-containing protein n=1 Tax=Dictyocaulus viviparus TaxID=29172 RepID=A0A0D8Y9S0_DICVI|nr:hypothetical protein DICVIV_00026 [Dictyocaulus viviparus]
MNLILISIVLTLSVLLDSAPLPLVKDTKCTLPANVKKIFLEFLKKHKFPTNWDCGLENLAKGELDRAEKATKDFPLSDVAAKYYTLTSKGKYKPQECSRKNSATISRRWVNISIEQPNSDVTGKKRGTCPRLCHPTFVRRNRCRLLSEKKDEALTAFLFICFCFTHNFSKYHVKNVVNKKYKYS